MNTLDDLNAQERLPSEVEDLYGQQAISLEEIDSLLNFRKKLIKAAPQPRNDFQEQLDRHLRAELGRQNHSRRKLISLGRFSVRVAAVLTFILAIGIGAVFAMDAILSQFIAQDDGLNNANAFGEGIEYNLIQTRGSYSLNLKWVHTDNNRLATGFTVSGFDCSDSQYAFCSIDVHLFDDNQVEIPMISGQGDDGETVRSYLFNFDVANFASRLEPLNLKLQVTVLGAQHKDIIPSSDDPRITQISDTPLSEPLILTFTAPVNNNSQVLTNLQTVTDQDIAITIRRVMVSPSQTRIAVCFVPPSSERDWTTITRLKIAEEDSIDSNGVQSISKIGEAGGEICNEHSYNSALLDYTGDWHLEITELIGFGINGNSQQRIPGNWAFEFRGP